MYSMAIQIHRKGNFRERMAQCKYRDFLPWAVQERPNPIDLPFGLWTWVVQRKHKFSRVHQVAPMCLHGKAYWRHLGNTIEPSICGGNAFLCQITFDHTSIINSSLWFCIPKIDLWHPTTLEKYMIFIEIWQREFGGIFSGLKWPVVRQKTYIGLLSCSHVAFGNGKDEGHLLYFIMIVSKLSKYL